MVCLLGWHRSFHDEEYHRVIVQLASLTQVEHFLLSLVANCLCRGNNGGLEHLLLTYLLHLSGVCHKTFIGCVKFVRNIGR